MGERMSLFMCACVSEYVRVLGYLASVYLSDLAQSEDVLSRHVVFSS